MAWPLIIALLTAVIWVFSQFGRHLAARNALSWWAMAAFVIVAAVSPESLRPVADAFGVELVSNLVLGGLTLFLFVSLLGAFVETTSATRKLRLLTSRAAARRFAGKGQHQGSALVVLPCFNEEGQIPAVAAELEKLKKSAPHIDYCFVNDGSRDGSETVLRRLCPNNYVSHDVNVGVAGVLLTGFAIAREAGFELVVQCDGDGQHPVSEISQLIHVATTQKCDMVIGSRFVSGAPPDVSTTKLRRAGIVVLRLVLRAFKIKVQDPTSGFRVYGPKARRILETSMPDEYPEPESIALVALGRGKVGEVPIGMSPRQGGASSLAGLGSAHYMLKVIAALIGLRLRERSTKFAV